MFKDTLYDSATIRVRGKFFHSALECVNDKLQDVEVTIC